MGAPNAVDVATTAPGRMVDITVPMVGPTGSGEHKGTWQLRNGTTYFKDPMWVIVNVGACSSSGRITVFDMKPGSPSAASTVHLVGRVKYFSDFRAMRFVIGNQVHEDTNRRQVGDQLEISYDWNTASMPRGTHTVAFEVASKGDTNWAHPGCQAKSYQLTGTPVVTSRPPDRPVLKSPYDWYLKDLSGSAAPVELCVYPSSDPDGDSVQYYFQILNQIGDPVANSGWTGSACWTNTFAASSTYGWKVKAGDGIAESDWSAETWHFSVAGGGVYIGSHSFYQLDTNETHMCVQVTYDGIRAPDVYAWLNYAPDNSESGEWRLLDHYGPEHHAGLHAAQLPRLLDPLASVRDWHPQDQGVGCQARQRQQPDDDDQRLHRRHQTVRPDTGITLLAAQ